MITTGQMILSIIRRASHEELLIREEEDSNGFLAWMDEECGCVY